MAGAAEAFGLSARRWRAGVLLLAVLAAFEGLLALACMPRVRDPTRSGSCGMNIKPSGELGWSLMTELLAGSPLAAKGAPVGDALRWDRAADSPHWRALDTQEKISLTLRTQGVERKLQTRPMPDPAFRFGTLPTNEVTGRLGRGISLGLGVLLIVR